MKRGFLETLIDARLDEAIDEASTGRPLIARLRRSGTLEQLLARALTGPASLDPVKVEVEEGRSPQQSLLDAAARVTSNVETFGDFCTAPSLTYKLFVADVRGREASGWLTLAGTFATQRGTIEDGPGLVVVTDRNAAPAGCDLLDDGSFVGPPEAAVFVRELRPRPDLVAECADAAAVEVSRGEVPLLAELLELPDRDRFNPQDWIGQQPVHEKMLTWRGSEEPCPTWLARHDPKRLVRRVWRGHVSVMFPWLAVKLGTFLEDQGRRLPRELPDKHTGLPMPRDEFEWGDIVFALRPTAPEQAERAHRIRRVRNSLAHQCPITWLEAIQVRKDVEELLKWK